MLTHLQLVNLMRAALVASPAVASGNVRRQSERPMAADDAQMVVLRIVSSQAAPDLASLAWSSVVGVQCIARAGAGQAADEAVATLLETVHARIAADTGLAAAGYAVNDDVRIEWTSADADDRYGAADLIYTVRHYGALATASA